MDKGFFDALWVALLSILYLLHVYYAIKYANENKHLKEEIERLKHDLLQSEIKNLQHQNEELKRQNNFSTDTVK